MPLGRGSGGLGAAVTCRSPDLPCSRRSPPTHLFLTGRGAGMTRQAFWQLIKRYGARAVPGKQLLAARAAPCLRHAPHQPRRRPARGADAARPRRHLHHADLHPRRARAPEGAAREAPSRVADTPATVFLKANKVAYTEHEYEYVEHGGTEVSASSLGVPEHRGREDAGDAGRGRQAAHRADARRQEGLDQEPCAAGGPETYRAVQARRGAAAFGLPGRRHLAVRHEEADAGLHGTLDPRTAEDLHQRRAARIPGRHCARRNHQNAQSSS